MAETVRIGVIGGSGLYKMPEITDKVAHVINTPFGRPSGEVIVGTLRGKRVAFIPRHGQGHIYMPSTVPYRANIFALKTLGVKFVISVSACGSLREDYAPGHLAIPEQIYDNTKSDRGRTFFEEGLVAHVAVADPFCSELNDHLYEAAARVGKTEVHRGATFITVEGSRFSTRGESHIFRSWGCSIIGMTASPEVFLAREAEMCYSAIAHITDYDVWHSSEEPVTSDMVLATMRQNLTTVQEVLSEAVETLDEDTRCACHTALDDAIVTSYSAIPQAVLERLDPIVHRRFAKAFRSD